jgi:polar amino acid transport system substrate-binding protein
MARPRLKATLGVGFALVLTCAGAMTAPGAAHAAAHASNNLHLIHAGTLTVGSDTTYPPMESVDKNSGKYVGADVDLAQALAKAMGLKGATIVNNSYNTIQPALFRHKFDVIMSSMSDTPERRQKIAFVDYMRGDEAIVVRSSSNIHTNSYTGMCGLSVAVEAATTELIGMQDANKHCKKQIDIKQFTGDTDAFQAFMSGHADAYTGDYVVAAQYVKAHSPALRLAGKTFSAGGPYGIGLLKTNPALKAALQSALKKIRANGQYTAILKKWNISKAAL